MLSPAGVCVFLFFWPFLWLFLSRYLHLALSLAINSRREKFAWPKGKWQQELLLLPQLVVAKNGQKKREADCRRQTTR